MSKSLNPLTLVFLMLSIAGYSQTVTIGTQIWSTKNLDVATFRNGDPIREAKTAADWRAAGTNGEAAWCYYENDAANGQKFGKLYNWYVVKDTRGLCPTGWHVPNNYDWKALADYLGGQAVGGTKLKSTSGWEEGGNGNNSSGFNGLAGGYRHASGSFGGIGGHCGWWCTSEDDSSEDASDLAWAYGLNSEFNHVDGGRDRKSTGLYVRCLRD